MTDVVLRLCGETDAAALRRIAERDSTRPLAGPVLGAEVEGDLRAAVSLRSGRVVADPFFPTAELVELLCARAEHLHSDRGVAVANRSASRQPRGPAAGRAAVQRAL